MACASKAMSPATVNGFINAGKCRSADCLHMAEMQPAAVSLIESGRRDVPMSALWMLAGALGVPATRLIEPAADTPEPDVPV